MAKQALAYQTEWPIRVPQSLAGQTAVVIRRDGTRRAIRFGADVRLSRETDRQPSALWPVVEGHIEGGESGFDSDEDRDLELSDGTLFRIWFSYQTFFFAVEPQLPASWR